MERTWLSLDEGRASTLAALFETIVPGCSRVEPVVYADAVLAAMPDPAREGMFAAIDALADVADGGASALADRVQTPEFGMIRALAVESFYSDFVAPGVEAESAWQEIDFQFPLTERINKDWSYLGVRGA